MKKIFTLLFSMAMLSTAFAQYGQNGQQQRGNDVYASNANRDNERHDDNYSCDDKNYGRDNRGSDRGSYMFTLREKDMQVAQIYREYDYKIQSVKARNFLSWYQKKRLINDLQNQRDNAIADINYRFNSKKNKFCDDGRGGYKRH
jgi:hypothetical protein